MASSLVQLLAQKAQDRLRDASKVPYQDPGGGTIGGRFVQSSRTYRKASVPELLYLPSSCIVFDMDIQLLVDILAKSAILFM